MIFVYIPSSKVYKNKNYRPLNNLVKPRWRCHGKSTDDFCIVWKCHSEMMRNHYNFQICHIYIMSIYWVCPSRFLLVFLTKYWRIVFSFKSYHMAGKKLMTHSMAHTTLSKFNLCCDFKSIFFFFLFCHIFYLFYSALCLLWAN